MKLIEALKKIQDLMRKAEDLLMLVKNHCAIQNFETPKYSDQKEKIREWIQSHSDILKEILRLRVAIQRTNLETEVTIELDGNHVTKTIAEWIHRRRDLAGYERSMWGMLTDRGIREGTIKLQSGNEMDVKIIRYYDPETRDKKLDQYSSEPSIIDARLEIVNAVTDLIE